MLCIKCKKEIDTDSIFCRFCGKKQTTEVKKTLKRANGTGSVYKLSGRRRKPWVASISKKANGEQKKIIIGLFETKTEALNALDSVRLNKLQDTFGITVEDIYNDWSKWHYEKISNSAKNTYKAAWNYLQPYAKLKMRDFNSRHIQEAIDYAEISGKSKATCDKIKIVAGKICEHAMKDDIINKNYAQFVSVSRGEVKEKQIFSRDEIALIWNYQTDRTAQIILVLLYTGVRINELFAIEMKNVDMQRKIMIGGSKTDAGKERVIPIHESIYPIIKKWTEKEIESKYLICNTSGGKVDLRNFRKRNFYPFLTDIGILEEGEAKPRLTPHSTRHTFISEMVKNNSKPEYLQRIVGHEKYETTIDFYTHIQDSDIINLVSEVNSGISYL